MIVIQWRQAAVLSASLAVGLIAVPARAQQPPPQPSGQLERALFQADREDRTSRRVLTLSGSVSESYDDNILREQDGPSLLVDPRVDVGGFYSRGDLGLFYGRRSNRRSFAVGTGVGASYYPGLADLRQLSYRGHTDGSVQLRRARLTAHARASRLPYFLFGAFPAFTDPQTALVSDVGMTWSNDFAVVATPANQFSGGAGLSHPLGRRASFDLGYDVASSRYPGAEYVDQIEHGARSRVSFQTSRYSSLNGGYSYRVAEYDRSTLVLPLRQRTFHSHDVEIGVDYNRPLSPTRRFRLSAGAGASVTDRNLLAAQDGRTYYDRMIGFSSLRYDLSRAWFTRAEFRRSLDFIEGLAQPFFSNGISASLGGVLGRRIEVTATGRYSRSAVGIEVVERGYDSRAASLSVRYGLTRELAVSTEYVYYQYKFTEAVNLPSGFRPGLERQLVRVGVSFGVPLLRQRTMP